MKKSRYSEEQINYALKQAETSTPVAEVLRYKAFLKQVLEVQFPLGSPTFRFGEIAG